MCGIAGIIGSNPRELAEERYHMRRMLAMIRHRGPDQFGIYQEPTATLGSARLSIIDLAGGQQPISNEDKTLWIVFNGEIFNFVELRADLERRGHRFATNTDTEALLHLYEDLGADCLDQLNGQFAFAIWDIRRRRLFLGRDRMGIRPVFYAQRDGAFLFASEMKALLAYPGVSAEIDPVKLDQIFTYWGPLPGGSIFRGIHELPPGHFLTYSGGEITLKQYWDLSFPPEAATSRSEMHTSEYLERFKELLVDATLVRLRSDVPVGAYLSGGLDSSVIARLVTAKANNHLSTLSITFEDPYFNESSHQIRMSRYLGTRHEVVHATYSDIARVFPDVIWHTETPITRTAPAPMFLLSRLARDSGYKVVLTGEGADEVLGGYDIFKEAAIRRFWARRPESTMRPLLLRRLYRDIPGIVSSNASCLAAFFRAGLTETDSPYYSHLVRWRNNGRVRRFYSSDTVDAIGREAPAHHLAPELPPLFNSWGALQRCQYLESRLFLSQYLLSSQGDRMGMAHSVESRMPYLDYRIVEFCNQLPSAMKLRGLTEKYLLKLLGRELLPPEVWQRPKHPYRAPIHRSFFGRSAPDYVRELLSPDAVSAAGLFKPAAVSQLVAKVTNGRQLGETDDVALAGILSAQLVNHHFVSHFRTQMPLSEKDDVKICVAGLPAGPDSGLTVPAAWARHAEPRG